MKVCDICGKPSTHTSYAYVEEDCGKNIDLCSKCWKSLHRKEIKYNHIAYKETVKEIAGNEQPHICGWFKKPMR